MPKSNRESGLSDSRIPSRLIQMSPPAISASCLIGLGDGRVLERSQFAPTEAVDDVMLQRGMKLIKWRALGRQV